MTEYLDAQVKQITAAAVTSRELAVAAEANQLLVEYIDWLKDLPSVDEPIVVDVDGQRIRFKNDDDFANWLSEEIKHE